MDLCLLLQHLSYLMIPKSSHMFARDFAKVNTLQFFCFFFARSLFLPPLKCSGRFPCGCSIP